eukprot:scaffold37547_cov75-Cyclotella_meneghiniana.AAC.2
MSHRSDDTSSGHSTMDSLTSDSHIAPSDDDCSSGSSNGSGRGLLSGVDSDDDSVYSYCSVDSDVEDSYEDLLPMMKRYSGSAETNVDHYSDLRDLEDLHFLHSSAMDLRNERWDHERLDWAKHVEQLQHEDRFATEYLMKLPTYNKLIRILDPILERVEFNSRCSEPIQVEHIIAHGIRVLRGGTQSDNRHLVVSSIAAAYAAFDDFIDAPSTQHVSCGGWSWITQPLRHDNHAHDESTAGCSATATTVGTGGAAVVVAATADSGLPDMMGLVLDFPVVIVVSIVVAAELARCLFATAWAHPHFRGHKVVPKK